MLFFAILSLIAGCQQIADVVTYAGTLPRGEVLGAYVELANEINSLSPTASSTAEFVIPDFLVQVDKEHGIDNYAPQDLVDLAPLGAAGKFIRQPVFESLRAIVQAATQAGNPLAIRSAYRSYQTQKSLFASYTRSFGNEAARFSAKPGHSEHQLGTAVDFAMGNSRIDLTAKFANTPQGEWLKANAVNYGFAESYPPGRENITGYIYEPWHYRYIGKEAAAKWQQSRLTLNEFLGQDLMTVLKPEPTKAERIFAGIVSSLLPPDDNARLAESLLPL